MTTTGTVQSPASCLIRTAITYKPIDLSFILTIGSQYPECGAMSTFFGSTRNTFHDKNVQRLEYEAYVPMALKEMHRICTSIVHKYSNAANTDKNSSSLSSSSACYSCQHKTGTSNDESPSQHKTGTSNDESLSHFPPVTSSTSESHSLSISSTIPTHSIEGLRYIQVIHRLGIVPVGEISIAIIGLSPHRLSAINGVHDIINEIKATVPIWKKEIYSNPSHTMNAPNPIGNETFSPDTNEDTLRTSGSVWKANSECPWNK